MESLIKVTQLPIIEENLRSMKEDVERVTNEAVSLVCTAETLQTVKEARSGLSKKFSVLEEQRKAVKQAIMEPYNRFELVYKDVTGAFRTADAGLKAKIVEVESGIKDACEAEMREFFAELVQAEHVEWLTFDRMRLDINLTEAKKKTHKRLREQIAAFVSGVSQDVTSISSMEGADEILVEYKSSLSLSSAVGTVFERHRRTEAEKEAAEARRKAQEADEAAATKVEGVYTAESQKPLQPPTEAKGAVSENAEEAENPVPPVTSNPAEKVFQMVFTCHGTIDQLKKLKEFMNKEGIRYE